jgi:hypothetical protein
MNSKAPVYSETQNYLLDTATVLSNQRLSFSWFDSSQSQGIHILYKSFTPAQSGTKVKVQLITHHEAQIGRGGGEHRYSPTLSLTSAIRWDFAGQSHATAASPLGKREGTPCTGGWIGPRTSLVGYGISLPSGFNSETVHLVA